jgi:ribosomal protein L11 methyltransferase
MKNKSLWRISVATTLEAEDAVAELLGTIFNCNASSYFDAEPQTSVVSIYSSEKGFLSGQFRKAISAGLIRIEKCGLKIGAGKIKIAKMRREDWVESWKRHFKPIEIGNSLLVKPSWSKRRAKKNQAVVILDPGLSFGTGQHPTTEFCLREIVAAVGRPPQIPEKMKNAALCREAAINKSFLDIGTGSGILAIAAAKLGCKPVRAIDFDPEAVRVARANARVNRVLKEIKIAGGDVTEFSTIPKRRFDLVCANLISNLLIAERRKIAAQLKSGGVLVLAGILKSEFLEVKKAFESLGLKLISSRSKKEWRSGSFSFRARKKF